MDEPVHYLDHAATTPMVPAAVEAMTRHLRDVGNPNSLHASGRAARRVVEESRETIAQALNCRPGEVVFTSGGTESDNLALKGLHWARRAVLEPGAQLISTAVEHHAVLDPLQWLADAEGAPVCLLGVDQRGRLDLAELEERLAERPTSVVSVMWANNEVGTIQPVAEVVALAAERGVPVHTDAVQALGQLPVDFAASGVDQRGRLDLAELEERLAERPTSVVSVMWANNEVGTIQPVAEVVALAAERGVPVHTDAVQAVGAVPVDFAASGVDALTLTGHKLGGPYGVGALVVRRETTVTPLSHGGGQERDIRSGTLDAPAIAGFAAAVEMAVKHQSEHHARMVELRDDLVRRVVAAVPGAHLHGPQLDHPGERLPGNAHVGFPGCEGDSLLMLLDARGIECSTGSACSAGVAQPSHVLLAMGCSEEEARHSLRFSLGHTSTQADVDAVVEAIVPVVERARAAARRS